MKCDKEKLNALAPQLLYWLIESLEHFKILRSEGKNTFFEQEKIEEIEKLLKELGAKRKDWEAS